jgi:hypothetical protein
VRARLIAVPVAALGLSSAIASCSSVPPDARIGVSAPDGSETAFGPVGDFVGHRCGTLDCHGQMGRNLRIWSCDGMRLADADTSGCGLSGSFTTPEEHQATYRSLVGLEPTVMSVVVQGHGAQPEFLTFVRKARGLEAHVGGQLIEPGDDQDTCITSWLSGSTDLMACQKAILIPMFPVPDASTE